MAVQRAIQEHTSRPVTVQRQLVQPALRAADLHTQQNKRLAVQREALQREAAALGPISPEAITQAVQRQQAPAPPVPMKPQSLGDWVTVMRFQAEQAQGCMMQTREAMQYTALQRQVANTIAQSFRQDRQPAQIRHEHYAGHLATLQRSPASAPVAAVALQLMPAGERPAVQRAVDEVLQREAEQQGQDAQAMKLHSIQRQLDELEQEATRPVMQRIQQRQGGGRALPEAVQRHLEHGLNHDLSAVRIHDDQEADKMAKKVNAVAFTTGQDIYFRAGKFNPNSQSGLELLAHEVTHTVQQSRGQVGKGIDPDSGLEQEAREMGRKLAVSSANRNYVSKTDRKGRVQAPFRRLNRTAVTALQLKPSLTPQQVKELSEAKSMLKQANRDMALEIAGAAADLAGLVDPTPISDGIGAALSLARGDYVGAGLSVLSMIPYVGDSIGKPLKTAKNAKRIDAITREINRWTAVIRRLDPASLKNSTKTAEAVSSQARPAVTRAIRPALKEWPASRAKEAVKGFANRAVTVKGQRILLTKERLEYILTRHHLNYYTGGRQRAMQTFFPEKMTLQQVADAAMAVVQQNSRKIAASPAAAKHTLYGVVNGNRYEVVIDGGKIVHMVPQNF